MFMDQKHSYALLKRQYPPTPKLIFRYHKIPFRIDFFLEIGQLILNSTWNCKGPETAKTRRRTHQDSHFPISKLLQSNSNKDSVLLARDKYDRSINAIELKSPEVNSYHTSIVRACQDYSVGLRIVFSSLSMAPLLLYKTRISEYISLQTLIICSLETTSPPPRRSCCLEEFDTEHCTQQGIDRYL